MFVFFVFSSFVFTNGLQQNYVNFENKYSIKPIPYNSLVDRIEKHEISKIYFSPRYESVISEEAGKVGDNLPDYSVTTISPFTYYKNRQKMDLAIEELLEKNILCTSEFNNLLNKD